MLSLYIAADLHSAIINSQKLTAAMKMPDWVDGLQNTSYHCQEYK
jgi:hypothetical protein